MNQYFSSVRFAGYLRKYIFDNSTPILVMAAAIILLPLSFCLVWPWISGCYSPTPIYIEGLTPKDPMWSTERGIYIALWFGVMCCASKCYSSLATKQSRISAFMTPASSLEKFITYFLIYVVGVIAVFVGSVFLSDAIRVLIFRAIYPGADFIQFISPRYLVSLGSSLAIESGELTPAEYANITRITSFIFSAIILNGLLIQSLCALGGTIWVKNPLLKTVCAMIVMLFATMLLFSWGTKLFYGGLVGLKPRFDESCTNLYSIISFSILIIFTWTVSYFRFKEWGVK